MSRGLMLTVTLALDGADRCLTLCDAHGAGWVGADGRTQGSLRCLEDCKQAGGWQRSRECQPGIPRRPPQRRVPRSLGPSPSPRRVLRATCRVTSGGGPGAPAGERRPGGEGLHHLACDTQ